MGVYSTFGDHYLKMFLKGHPTSPIHTGTEQVSSSWSAFTIACSNASGLWLPKGAAEQLGREWSCTNRQSQASEATLGVWVMGMDTWPLRGDISGMNQLQLFPPLCLSAPDQISERERDSLSVGMSGCEQGKSWIVD